ncbi:MAG: 2-(1,2-epoxy-1,2-dihydrophenyl)acetyl-CoA isomerase [Saprospiraceae bacterium]|nr:2-(1,2-epoxy-1,2-dihydrophenyl)acetyl-CoA isomerase [Saprospiraceae bacterium]
MSELIQVIKDNHIAKISLNRPESYNSFNREMALALVSALDDCESDDNIRVVYLTGIGKAFCAGQDLKEVTNPETNIGFERIVSEHYNPIILKIYNLKKPVIAAVNGVAAGAGANIALVCDIIVAKESASFIQAFSKIGLVPDSGGSYTLPRLIGFQKALAITLLGDKVSAQEADALGMIYKYFSDDTFEESAYKIATKLAALPPIGIQHTKTLYNKGLCNNLETQLENEKEYQVKAGSTEDYQECVNAFLEKRKPVIKGK